VLACAGSSHGYKATKVDFLRKDINQLTNFMHCMGNRNIDRHILIKQIKRGRKPCVRVDKYMATHARSATTKTYYTYVTTLTNMCELVQ